MLIHPDAFTDLPRAAVRPLAQWFVETGEKLHDAADKLEEIGRWRETYDARRRTFKGAAEVMAVYLADGRTPDEASRIVQAMTGMRDDQMAEVMRFAKGPLARHRLKIRNAAIMKLVRRGWYNREIADKYDLHEKHVARIIGAERKRAA